MNGDEDKEGMRERGTKREVDRYSGMLHDMCIRRKKRGAREKERWK